MKSREEMNNNQMGQQELQIVKASACPAEWSKMSGNDRIRYSESCGHFVYNAEGLKATELLSQIMFREGVRPSRLYKREDGTFMVNDCCVGARRAKLQRGLIAGGVLSAITLFCLALTAPHPVQTPSVAQTAVPAPVVQAKPEVAAQTSEKANVAIPTQPAYVQDLSGRNATAATLANMGRPAQANVQQEVEQTVPEAAPAVSQQVAPPAKAEPTQPAPESKEAGSGQTAPSQPEYIAPLNQPQSIQAQIQPEASKNVVAVTYEKSEPVVVAQQAPESEKPQYVWTAPSVTGQSK